MFDFALRSEVLPDDVHVLAVAGEIDLFTAPDLKHAAAEAIEGGARRIVIDLTDTRFLDSTGLGVLIGIAKRVRPAGGDVAIVNTEPTTASTFAITGLDGVLSVVPTRDLALEQLRATQA
ncbi:anti-sigma factor antagonist [Conexibacter sp. W3-3-2]|uniref:Anti-sigma factor antagonist n=1 Tax=Paraconexibacter algicola TaxID=2133960 RepID=A0A2T4UBJ0_9ACTN|nr:MULTISPECIES: STAS domain-containing protein [Solirubrobacterales]MTD44382.1 anti-sigma factor antagonist [Conexibacter sp. W3-3-2]PTL54260.1 anti-sigma factor antagonist [Paraconexibacter algicola]